MVLFSHTERSSHFNMQRCCQSAEHLVVLSCGREYLERRLKDKQWHPP